MSKQLKCEHIIKLSLVKWSGSGYKCMSQQSQLNR